MMWRVIDLYVNLDIHFVPQVKEEEDLHEQDMEKLRTAYQQMLAQVWKSYYEQ